MGMAGTRESPGVYLWWIPLGAGGHFVRLNGRIYEFFKARQEQRKPMALFHSALEVHVPDGRFVIENAWPIPVADGAKRGVVQEGPVFSPRLGRMRTFRYEVRRWRDGIIYDAAWAVGGARRLSDDSRMAQRILDLVPTVPAHVWGRRVPGTDEMWNSNSVVSWLLTKGEIDMERIQPPPGGRAPGWKAGINIAKSGQV